MNIEEYISSGVLEAYAAGLLPEEERLVVEQNLAKHPELVAELKAIELLQEQFLQKAAIKPRAQVKEKLFEKIETPKAEAKVVSMVGESNIMFWKYAVAASISLTLITSYLAYDYYNKWRTTVVSLNDMISRNQQIADEYNVVNNRIDRIEEDIKVLNDPAFKRVVLAGTANAPSAKAFVYWNESSNEVFLSLQNMRELSKDNQYQLWAIIDGKPVDAGVFDGNIAGLLKMKAIGKGAAAFAVTIEPRGGQASPSLETMQVLGNVVNG